MRGRIKRTKWRLETDDVHPITYAIVMKKLIFLLNMSRRLSKISHLQVKGISILALEKAFFLNITSFAAIFDPVFASD
ncbi:hypothetical protein Scep_021268 [Stephania cephalantha]|uniref:Uncharacterized protein n=1 Tax=Stephania cephalantha TaxID=152367 RepID=A0AAP0FD43_9MAGN